MSDRGRTRRSGARSDVPPSVSAHIVGKKDKWILGRYMGILQEYLGWTQSEQIRPDVDVNYFLPYLAIPMDIKLPTCSAAWFTHLEEEEKSNDPRSKVNRWWYAAKTVDLRLVQAQKYQRMLEPYGLTMQMTSPVDITMFKPRKLRVGVAGRVYNHPSRKGEGLVEKLVKTGRYKVVASGSGWPCPTKMYKWDEMPGYYQSLDVFLITSSVEGGPDTVIEALACGVPVLGPTDVGMLDEMPIMHYERGNFKALLSRLKAFEQGRLNRRKSVAHRSERNWAQMHAEAMARICEKGKAR